MESSYILPGALNDHLVAKPAADGRVGARYEQRCCRPPANHVRRRRRITRPCAAAELRQTLQHAAGEHEERAPVPRSAAQRREQGGRCTGGDHDAAGAKRPAACRDIRPPAAEVIRFAGDPSNRAHPIGGRGGETTGGPVRFDRRPSRLERPCADDPDLGLDSRALPATARACGAPRLQLALERTFFGVVATSSAPRGSSRISTRAGGQRAEIERSAAPDLPGLRAARRPIAFSTSTKLTPGFVGDPSRRRSGAAAPDPRRFDQHDLDAGRGARIGRGTPGEASADDHDVGIEMTAMAGICGNAGPGKNVDPEGLPVLDHRFGIRPSAASSALFREVPQR